MLARSAQLLLKWQQTRAQSKEGLGMHHRAISQAETQGSRIWGSLQLHRHKGNLPTSSGRK